MIYLIAMSISAYATSRLCNVMICLYVRIADLDNDFHFYPRSTLLFQSIETVLELTAC